MSSEQKRLLSEVLRPKCLSELNLPATFIARLEAMERSGFPMNMIFYGQPGIGKTSAARIILKNSDVLELNGSHNLGDKAMVNKILAFSNTVSLFDRPKVIFIDEADYMPKGVQDALRHPIEQVSNIARFIMTANDFTKLTPALRSRCMCLSFDVAPKDRSEVAGRMVCRYQAQLDELGITVDPQRLQEIVGIYFPDLRSVANQIDFEFGY